ncbi:hypothetical protein Dimus_031268 [Dionaea muscipula]
MKTISLSSPVLILGLLLLLSPSLSQNPNNLQLFLDPSSRNHHHHRRQHQLHHLSRQSHRRFCDSFPTRYPPPSICIQFQSLLRNPPLPPPPPPPSEFDTDPRYGVQKRLVPGGPNPLHN